MIGSSILRNSDKMFLDSYARCNLRMFSCKKTRARANTYFQKFEVWTDLILRVLWFAKIYSIYWCYQAFGKGHLFRILEEFRCCLLLWRRGRFNFSNYLVGIPIGKATGIKNSDLNSGQNKNRKSPQSRHKNRIDKNVK